MDNDMVLEMKAETMQIALTLCSYHDDQPPELGGKSQERSAGGRGGTGELYVSWFSSFPSLPRILAQHAQVVPVLCSTRKLNLRDGVTTKKLKKLLSETFNIKAAHRFNTPPYF